MCHIGGWASMPLKASVRPLQESGAHFDGEMAVLQFLFGCLPVSAMGTLQGAGVSLSVGMSVRRAIKILALKWMEKTNCQKQENTCKEEREERLKGLHLVILAHRQHVIGKRTRSPRTLRCI